MNIIKDDNIKVSLHKNATESHLKKMLKVVKNSWDNRLDYQKLLKITDNNAEKIFFYYFNYSKKETNSVISIKLLNSIEEMKQKVINNYVKRTIDNNVKSNERKNYINYEELIITLKQLAAHNKEYKKLIYNIKD